MIISSLRSVRTNSPSLIISQPYFTSKNLTQKTSVIRFKQAKTSAASSDQPETERHKNMDKDKENKKEKPNNETGDVMSHSFGEGYATRCGDDGFGGIYGRNEPESKNPDDRSCIHENHPEYDKTQGSEVKEKEKARFQTGGAN